MRLRQWGRRSIQARLVLALGLLAFVSLAAGGLAWLGLSRTEQALSRDHAAGLSDLRQVLGLAERSARLAAEAPALARSTGEGAAVREAEELRAGIAELRALAANLPESIRANAAMPTDVPAIQRLAERLEGILDHLMPVVAEQVAIGRELSRHREALVGALQSGEVTGGAASAQGAQRALALVSRVFTAETPAAVEALWAGFREERERLGGMPGAAILDEVAPLFDLRIRQISAGNRIQVFLAAVERAAAEFSAGIRSLADAVERNAIRRSQATSAELTDGKLALLAGGILSLLAAGALATVLMRNVARNVSGAAQALTRLAAGDGDASPPGLGRDDEIGDLARAFQLFKAQAAEREELAGQLRQAQKMEAIGQLTGGIAHDFNNLLAAISSNVQLVADAADTTPQQRARATRALDAVERGNRMVQRLLAFARRQPLAPQIVDINHLVTDLAELLGPGFRDIVLTLDLDPEAGRVRVDPGQMEQALLNLVINARDAIQGEGRIVIETRLSAEGMQGRTVRVCVRDTGKGMSEDVVRRAFEPFFSTKPFGSGSGLGLSTVYGFVRQSGGEIAIDSREGEGTAIAIDLPRAPITAAGGAGRDGASAPLREPSRNEAGRILIVEDDDAVREAAMDVIRSLGHEAQAVMSGEAALRRVGEHRFDVLFTDIVLPGGMNGFSLAEAARALDPALSVLCCSGFAHEAEAQRARRDWLGPLLAKPYATADLAARLDQAVARSRAVRAAR